MAASPEKRVLKIGNAGGYWGDDPHALARQVTKGRLDYITIDFLAEITMSILKKQQAKNPETGFAYDILPMLEPVLAQLVAQKTCLITNAGGINPRACAEAIYKLGEKLGLSLKIGVVCGDDIAAKIGTFESGGVSFVNMESGAQFSSVRDRIEVANVYFGALPVVEALRRWQPNIIVTGRVTDTGITLAPMIYEFGWSFDDFDKLASGIIAGHILECGSQSTGGNFTDWRKVGNFKEIGYPIAEVEADGSFCITKHPNTGGLVTVDTVREQLFYEMGHPQAYITPDVVADFSSIRLTQDGENRVRVTEVKGYQPTDSYKVSMAYRDGYKIMGAIVISGPDARAKAEAFAEIFWARVDRSAFSDTLTEYLGWNACHRSLGREDDGNEIVLRLGARGSDEKALKNFGRLVPSLVLSGPPGVTVFGGAPKPGEVISYWPALMPKLLVKPVIGLRSGADSYVEEVVSKDITGTFKPTGPSGVEVATRADCAIGDAISKDADSKNCLADICLARSGDKGDMVNIGLLARGPKAYAFIKEKVTAQYVKNMFQELCHGTVTRHSLDKMSGLNFLLDASLGGGGSCTLRTDAQGKTFSQALLRQPMRIPAEILLEMQESKR